MLAATVVVGALVKVREEDRLEAGSLDAAVGVELDVELVGVRGDGSGQGVAAEGADLLLVVLRPAVHVDEVVVARLLLAQI